MSKKKIVYINIALAVLLIVIIGLILRPILFAPRISEIGKPQIEKATAAIGAPKVYSIKSVKKYLPQAVPAKEPASFSEMYKEFPIGDTGDNMVEAWARMKPESKKRFTELLDKEIKDNQELLKTEPQDKHAKNILFISQSLKKMALDGFDYKIKKSASK